jgi:hypothetical protein
MCEGKNARNVNGGGKRRNGNEVAPGSLLVVRSILFAVSPLRSRIVVWVCNRIPGILRPTLHDQQVP